MNVSKITIGRVFNLGNYEHIRYEVTVDLAHGDSAATAMIGLEKIVEGLKPNRCVKSSEGLKRAAEEIATMRTMPAADFERRYGTQNSAAVLIEQYEEQLKEETEKAKRAAFIASRSRRALNEVEVASKWTDAKLSWEDYE